MFQSEALSFCRKTAVSPSMPPIVATFPFSLCVIGEPPDSEASAWYEADPDGASDQPTHEPSAPPATSLALVVFTGWSTTPADADGAASRSASPALNPVISDRRTRRTDGAVISASLVDGFGHSGRT